ncbi:MULTISPECIES: hydroxyethylthiazole kinase [Alteribacter]|uniref:Hydroxyethylthiazole kinase n=1 Tax=Alteribacter keqinensis TaxID=2483800 RepID=A0A3M7TW35_9BACI|nr:MULTISPECIES: hydroxyethylthiazole kinase [Alteribacter]MBM7095970.1 hydroxyethylthiazole kinase [Alteribacter salitolerans]RNA69788.1 hydroxyethylthiazole kinase [Alteribacter keqinensis]
MEEKVIKLRQAVEEASPLIHNITNVVVTNFTANGLYAIGASPVMANAREEVGEMASISQGLVLNIGTLNETQVESMYLAGKSANENNVPVVLDPVGAGATTYRTETARNLLNEINVTLIRGNAGEISNLINEKVDMKGVDSKQELTDAVVVAGKAAREFGTFVALTGKTDVVTDGERTYYIKNGSPRLTKVTGTGCLLSSVTSAFLAVGEDDPLEAVASAIAYYGIAAEVAAEKARDFGIGHFQPFFFNELETLDHEEIKQRLSCREEEI